MNMKKLFILMGILAVIMVVLGVSDLLKPDRQSIVKESGYEDIAPDGFLISDVAWFEVWRGGKESEKLIVNHKEKGKWTLGSKFDAPADGEKVEKFLTMFKDLLGEKRSESKDILGDYGLEKEAVHLKIVMRPEDAENPEILIGKESKFIRRKDQHAVYAIQEDFFKELKIYGEEDTPEGKDWLEKEIFSIDKSIVTDIDITYPDKHVHMKRVEKKAREKDSDTEEKTADTSKSEEKEYEWKIVSGLPEQLNTAENPAKKILDTIKELTCSDVVDPSEKKKWGLEKAGYILTVKTEDGTEKRITAGKPDADRGEPGYLIVPGRQNLVYEVGNWKFKKLFPKGKDLVDELPSPEIKSDDITKISVRNFEGKTFRIVKKGKDNYNVITPEVSLHVEKSICKKIFNGIANLKPEDFTSESQESSLTGLKGPSAAEITAYMKDDNNFTIRAGKKSRVINGYYYIIKETPGPVMAAAASRIETLFPPPVDLFDSDKVISVKPDNITSINIRTGKEVTELEQTDRGWVLAEAGKKVEADKEAVDTYLENLNKIRITGIEDQEGPNMLTSVVLGIKDGTSIKLFVRGDEKGNYTFTSEGLKGVFSIDDVIYKRISASLRKFRKEEPVNTRAPEAEKPEADKE